MDTPRITYNVGRSEPGLNCYSITSTAPGAPRLAYICAHWGCNYVSLGRRDNARCHLRTHLQDSKSKELSVPTIEDECQRIHQEIKVKIARSTMATRVATAQRPKQHKPSIKDSVVALENYTDNTRIIDEVSLKELSTD